MTKKDPLDFHLTISKKQFILKIELDCHMKFIALTIILMLTAGIAGYTVGNLKATKGSLPQLIQTSTTQPAEEKTDLFDNQTASITGSITSISDKTLTIVTSNNQTDQFVASDKLVVLTLDAKPTTASPGADIKSIELNKLASIQLQIEDGEYKVVTIAYLPATPPSAPKTPPNP